MKSTETICRILLSNWEWRNLSLASRLFDANGDWLGIDKKKARLFPFIQGHGSYGVLYFSSQGLVLPLTEKGHGVLPESHLAEIKKIIQKAKVIMGPEPLVRQYETKVLTNIRRSQDYDMLTLSSNTVKPKKPSLDRLTARKAGTGDLKSLLPLQALYEKEEVLIQEDRFSRTLCARNLQKVLETQLVYLAEYRGNTIAKANTNSWGLNYCQIGGVFTLPEYRRKNVSYCIMRTLLLDLLSKKRKVCLFVKKNNKSALNLYKNLGFIKQDDYRITYFF